MQVFEYHNSVLGVRASVLYAECGIMTYEAYKKRKIRQAIIEVRRACKGYPALINYEALASDWKEIIVEKFGDPYKKVQNDVFFNSLEIDTEAAKYYRDYRYDDNKTLSSERQIEYCMNASILKAIRTIVINKKAYCKSLGGKATKIWENISLSLNAIDKSKFPHNLPSNPRSLQRAVKSFLNESYYSLIHKNFGNTHSEKLSVEAKQWILSKWCDRVNKAPNTKQLFFEYNITAGVNGWEQLTDAKTIENFLYKPDVKNMWWGHRYGELKAKEKFNFQLSTKLPTMRDGLWYSDGTKLNYFYQNTEGKVCTISVYEIMDAYSEVLLGYHISETEDYQTQYNAYKMALQFAGHKPYQLGFDGQGGHKKLIAGSFLSKVAHLAIKTQPYNGKSKTIESAFNRLQSQHLKKDWFFTGQNIQSKKNESKANLEFINANKQNLPSLEDIKAKYKQRREEWNNSLHPATGKKRIDMYLSSKNDACPKVELWDMVDIFWIMRPEPVMYNAYGLTFKEKNKKYTYTVYNENGLPNMDWHTKNIDKKFFIKFDPDDMTMIYLFDKDSVGNLRFVTEARTKIEVARGKQEQDTFDTSYIAAVKKLNDTARIERMNKMDEILEKHGTSVEQYGLNTPKVLGAKNKTKGKTQKAATDFGKVLKEESELVEKSDPQEDSDIDIYKRL